MKNQVQLCTYVDRLGGGDINKLKCILNTKLNGIFGGVHMLPYYYPIDGEDAGFDPIDHSIVDQRLGDWSDVKELSTTHEVISDFIVNHISAKSPQFLDYLEKNEASEYSDLILTFDGVFPNGASETELLALYRPRPGLPFSKVKLGDGSEKLVWTTFTSNQIDIDVLSEAGESYISKVLNSLAEGGTKMLRLDAAGYCVKERGSNCFMTDATFAYIDRFTKKAEALGIEVLVEIHSHYTTQINISKRVDWVYDFALPPLVLHTLIACDSIPLQNWYKISPRNAITVLDTHDGIGIIDVAPNANGEGLLNAKQIDELVESIHNNCDGESRKATGAAASNVDLYQVNCSYYSALNSSDTAYIIARLIQFFSPGVPQVYYAGLLCEKNDMELLAKTNVGRDINRHYYSADEIDDRLSKPVVNELIDAIRLRNRHPAFNGDFLCENTESTALKLKWINGNDSIYLEVDLNNSKFNVVSNLNGIECSATSCSQFDSM